MNAETAKVKAKGKVTQLMMLLLCSVAIGGMYEYHRAFQPLDEVVMFYMDPTTVGTVSQDSVAVVKEEPTPEVQNNPKALDEFLSLMREIRTNVENVQVGNTVLDRLKQSESLSKQQIKPENHVFDTNIIEIYDSEKGIVQTIDTAEKPNSDDIKVENVSETAEDEAEIKNDSVEAEDAKNPENEALRQQIKEEINRVEEAGEEAPIVLIPGLLNPPAEDL